MFVSEECQRNRREGKIDSVTELFSLDIELFSVVQFFATKCQGQELLHADTLWLFLDNQVIKELIVILKEQELWEVVSVTCVRP